MPSSRRLIVQTTLITLLLLAGVLILNLPGRTYRYAPDITSRDLSFDTLGLGPAGNSPQGYRYSPASNPVLLQYKYVPRYSPLELRLRLDLAARPGSEPARVELYERTVEPDTGLRLVATLAARPGSGPVDYHIEIPARDSGEGLFIELRTANPSSGYNFIESELSLPATHVLNLFWPHPYWLAGLLLLAALTAWMLRAGLTFWETLVFCAMPAFVLATASTATYWNSPWMLLVATGLWVIFWLESRSYRPGARQRLWPLFAATGFVMLYFLFTRDYHLDDIDYYIRWGEQVKTNGIFNIYNYSFAADKEKPLNYLPLITYLLWPYRQLIDLLGLSKSINVWRIAVALLYLVFVYFIYLINRAAASEKTAGTGESASNPEQGNRWLALVAFNIALFFNGVNWGQTDMIAVLPLVIAFYFLYRRQPYASGVALGIVAISKPQAWFILPVLGWMLLQRCGRKQGKSGLILGILVATVLTLFAFGADPVAINTYLHQPQLTGEYYNEIGSAFNYNYLVLGADYVQPPAWLTLSGFLAVALVAGWILYRLKGYTHSLERYSLGAALQGLSCFTWLIKMHERYLIFGLPFLGLAALQNRNRVKIFLALSWMQLIHLVIGVFTGNHAPVPRRLYDSFFLWSIPFGEAPSRYILSAGTLALFGWLAFLFWKDLRAFPAKSLPAKEPAESRELKEV